MKITKSTFINKAVEQYATYMRKKEDDTAFKEMQIFLEELSIACKNKGIEEINGENFTIKFN